MLSVKQNPVLESLVTSVTFLYAMFLYLCYSNNLAMVNVIFETTFEMI